jgi:hypothetical protein
MKDAKPIKTPMGENGHLDLHARSKSIDQKVYRSMIGSLLYICASRPNIMLSVCMCARLQFDPKECHLVLVKRILRYLIHMPHFRLWYLKGSSFDLIGYSDSDYAGARLIGRAHQGLVTIYEGPWCRGALRNKILLPYLPLDRVCCRRPVLRATTMDEANAPGLWLQYEQSPTPM